MTIPTIPQPPENPQNQAIPSATRGETSLRDAAARGLELAHLGARIFETGAERPEVDVGVGFLRDVLRSAQLDLDLLGAAIEHVTPETAVRATARADHQITFALALHAFLERYPPPEALMLLEPDAEGDELGEKEGLAARSVLNSHSAAKAQP